MFLGNEVIKRHTECWDLFFNVLWNLFLRAMRKTNTWISRHTEAEASQPLQGSEAEAAHREGVGSNHTQVWPRGDPEIL